MKFYYQRLSTNSFLSYLSKENYAQTLAYMLEYRLHKKLKIIPLEHSIEISNEEITIFIILFSGFENEEYHNSLKRENVHYVHWDMFIQEMIEFESFKGQIKIIPIKSLCYTSFELDKENRDLHLFMRFLELNPLAV